MATRATTETPTRKRNRRATPKGETPDTQPLDSEGKENPETTAADTAPKGQETPPVDTSENPETTGQLEMEGDDFDPRKAELLDELFQLFNHDKEKEARWEWNSQIRFIYEMTDDELEAYKDEIILAMNERGLKRMETSDFDALQAMVSEIASNQEGNEGNQEGSE